MTTPESCCRLPSLRSFVLHGKALVVKSRGQTSKCSVLTVRLGHSLHFAVPSFSPSSAPIMQAFAPVIGFSLPEHQARNRLRMAADFQVFSSDLQFLTYPVPAQLYASCNTSALLSCLLQHRLLSLPSAQSLHFHGWAMGQRVFGQTSKCSVLSILNMLRRRPAVPPPLLSGTRVMQALRLYEAYWHR